MYGGYRDRGSRQAMDRETAFNFLCRMAEAIAKTFGRNCETLVQDMSKPDHPILAIYNGHVTGRKVGSTVDVFGSSGERNEAVFSGDDFVNHLVVTPLGQHIKSTSVHLQGKDYHYALGINFDFSAFNMARHVIGDLVTVAEDLQSAIAQAGQLGQIFNACVAAVGKPVSEMKRDDRVRLVGLMKNSGAFEIQKSVPFMASRLNVSRNTIYHYLNETKTTSKANEGLPDD
jgi:predicted transcriptional regulator YheO